MDTGKGRLDKSVVTSAQVIFSEGELRKVTSLHYPHHHFLSGVIVNTHTQARARTHRRTHIKNKTKKKKRKKRKI